jgi:cell wall-associated NlpC family hydrolase
VKQNQIHLFFLGLLMTSLLFSCKSTQQTKSSSSQQNTSERERKTELVIKEAESFLSTKYKAGGTSNAGMDCSGLVFTAYKKIDINLPRVSKDQSTIGKQIKLDEAIPGDLIFFATSGKDKGINHVGIITKRVSDSQIFFIHSSLKLGVTESNLQETYYQNSFVKVMRVY